MNLNRSGPHSFVNTPLISEAIKVGQFIKGLDIGGVNGGADVFGTQLCKSLQKIGVKSTLFVCFKMGTKKEQEYIEVFNDSEIPIIFLADWPGKTSLRIYLSAFHKLLTYLKKNPQDILHSHFHIGSVMAILSRLRGRVLKIVRTAHVDQEWKSGWEGPVKQITIRFLVFFIFPLLVDREGAVSAAAAKTLDQRWLANLLNKKSQVVYNAIAFDAEKMVLHECDEPLPKRVIVGNVGRLSEQKGLTYLLQAIPYIIKQFPQIEVWIIGEGPLEKNLKREAQEFGVESKVIFWGKRIDVTDLLSQMTLFVSSSIYEGLPTVVLESMAMRVPVVATDIPGTKEVIQNNFNGWLARARDPKDLADKITFALSSPADRKRVVEEGLKTLASFKIETSARQYADLYLQILNYHF